MQRLLFSCCIASSVQASPDSLRFRVWTSAVAFSEGTVDGSYTCVQSVPGWPTRDSVVDEGDAALYDDDEVLVAARLLLRELELKEGNC